jgi:hypothetical protein
MYLSLADRSTGAPERSLPPSCPATISPRSHPIPDPERDPAPRNLEVPEPPRQDVFADGTTPEEQEVQDRQIRHGDDFAPVPVSVRERRYRAIPRRRLVLGIVGLVLVLEFNDPEGSEHLEQADPESLPRRSLPARRNRRPRIDQQSRLGIESRESMPRTRDEPKQLRDRVQKVEDLREEEEEEGFRKVAEDADDGKRHAGEVAERVADKGVRWVPTLIPILRSAKPSRVRRKSKGQPGKGRGQETSTHQLCLNRPKQTPTRGSMKYRLNKCRSASS